MAIVTEIVDFSDGIPAQTYTMFASEKVSERNENCRFQPAYVRKATAVGGSRIARSYLLVRHSGLKAHQNREFFKMRHPNSNFLLKV